MAPGVSWKAEGPVRELRITVCQYPGETRLGLTWSTRERGDEPGQGHKHMIQVTDKKPVKSLAHALNLAAWLARRALAGQWEKIR